MRRIETEDDLDALHGEAESRSLEIKGIDPEKRELKKTEDIVKTVQGILNGVEEGGHIIIGLLENSDGEVDKGKKCPISFPCSIKGMNFQPKSYDEYRMHIYKMVRDNTHGYQEGMCTVRQIKAQGGGSFIVIEVRQSPWRPHRHNNGRCYIRRDGYNDEMTPDEQEFAIAEKHKRLIDEGYVSGAPRPRGVTPDSVAPTCQVPTTPKTEEGGPTFPEPGKPFVKLIPFGERGNARDITLLEGAQEFLKIVPSQPFPEMKNFKIKELMREQGSSLGPFGRWQSSWTEINTYGAVSFQQSAADETVAYNLTQVFKNGEILGVDAFLLNAERMQEFSGTSFPYIPTLALEDDFRSGLGQYLQFAKNKLNLPLPITFVAGLRGVEEYTLAVNPSRFFKKFVGNAVDNTIQYAGNVQDYNSSVNDLLLPFFEMIWESCGVPRPTDF